MKNVSHFRILSIGMVESRLITVLELQKQINE